MATRAKKQPKLRRTCGAMQVHQALLERFPGFRMALSALDHAAITRMRSMAVAPRVEPYRIQVVVHVVYNTVVESLSDAQVKSQIAALNLDFRAKNTDKSKTPGVWRGLVIDPNIEFALATKDPNGKPSTGINRVKTTKASFGADDSVKAKSKGGADAWPTNKYLNLWTCTLGDGLLGYAQFPGGPVKTDGVVILNRAFGTTGTAAVPFNKGRTATHEVGHWLNLRHIWGDTEHCEGTDLVDDTPNAQLPNFGKPKFPHISCQNGPNGDMFMNYMDYVDDSAMFMFSAQQVARMQATLEGPRKSLVSAGAAAARRKARR